MGIMNIIKNVINVINFAKLVKQNQIIVLHVIHKTGIHNFCAFAKLDTMKIQMEFASNVKIFVSVAFLILVIVLNVLILILEIEKMNVIAK